VDSVYRLKEVGCIKASVKINGVMRGLVQTNAFATCGWISHQYPAISIGLESVYPRFPECHVIIGASGDTSVNRCGPEMRVSLRNHLDLIHKHRPNYDFTSGLAHRSVNQFIKG
jgi:hypothetical protein